MTEFSTKLNVVTGVNPNTKEIMFPLKNVWSGLYNYFLTRDGKEIWSFFRENHPKKLQDKNGYVKLSGTRYNIHKIFKYTQKTESWKSWLKEYPIEIIITPNTTWTSWSDIGHTKFSQTTDEMIVYKNNFIIIKLNDDKIINFYHQEELAKQECERLAKLNPNQEFSYFQMKGSCKSDITWS